jgi:flagellar M-ring protein FliF
VVVNHKSVTDDKGKTTLVALAPEDIEKLTALVKESIGFKADRGDSVKVVNAPFMVEPVNISEVPWWKRPELLDMLRASAIPAALGLVALLVFFGMIRPTLRVALAPPALPAPGSTLNAIVADEQALGEPGTGETLALEAPKTQEKLDKAREFTRGNPAATASIVRGWVSGEPA